MKIDNISQNTSFQMNYKVLTMRNVKKDFTKAVEKSIKDIPDQWGEVLKRNNYKLYCSNSIADIFENEKLAREGAPEWEAVTCTYPLYRFMAITTRVEPKDIQKVVNHEAAHGILDCEGLMENRDLLDSLPYHTGTKWHERKSCHLEKLLSKRNSNYRNTPYTTNYQISKRHFPTKKYNPYEIYQE